MLQKFKNILLSAYYFASNHIYKTIRKSLYFDRDYYRQMNSDVTETGVDPLLHYITRGFAELRSPGPLFDSLYYIQQLPEFEKGTSDPLLHFLETGWKQGMQPNPFFDPKVYIQNNPELDFSTINPFTHFLQQGKDTEKTTSHSPYFDASYYSAKYPDVTASSLHPLVHYLTIGAREKRRPSLYFDSDWYLDKTPILHKGKTDPLSHYLQFGINEKKSPSPLFDPRYYATTYHIEEDQKEIDLFNHYLRKGIPEDHQPCSWFDPSFYRQKYLHDVQAIFPFDHFLATGVANGFYPNRQVSEFPLKPLISLLVPVYNVDLALLNNCIRSVLYQSYPHWELCLADDCSTRNEIRVLLESWANKDSRIKITFLEKNLGISGATNRATELATGEYFGFLDNDDELSADCLAMFVDAINRENADLYYSNENLIGEDSRQFSVFHKPGFNGELLLSHNYITHFVLVEKSLYKSVGGFDREINGAQDFDLFLKLSERAKKIVHIPEILYHWRASESSTSINHDQKEYANEAGRKAVENALTRRNIDGVVKFTDWKFYYRVKREISGTPLVSVVVFWDQESSEIVPWLQSLIAKTGYTNIELIILITDDSLHDAISRFGTSSKTVIACSIVSSKTSLTEAYYSVLSTVKGKLTTFVSSDLVFTEDGWLAALIEYGQQDEVGLVGGRLNCTAPHLKTVSPVPDLSLNSPLYFARYIQDCTVLMNGLQCPQEVQSVNGSLCLIKTEELKNIGGFSPSDFPSLFAFHDLSYKLVNLGKKNIYTPYSIADWAANANRYNLSQESCHAMEKTHFQSSWQEKLRQDNPFFHYGIVAENNISREQLKLWLTSQQ